MPLYSSTLNPYSPAPWSLYDEFAVEKSPGGEGVDELEIIPYLTDVSVSEPSSRDCSPHPEPVIPAVTESCVTDTDRQKVLCYGLQVEAIAAMLDGAIDPRWLTVPCTGTITINNFDDREIPPSRRSPVAQARAATPATPDLQDPREDGLEYDEDESGPDDDEYLPSDELEDRQRKTSKPTPSPDTRPSKKPRFQREGVPGSSPSTPPPNTALAGGYSKHRARNIPVSTDQVIDELSRIARKKTSTKRNSRRKQGRKNRDLSHLTCSLCTTRVFTRSSDLERHVLTHDQSRSSIVCIGLSVEEAERYGIDPTRFGRRHLEDELRIGGCGQHFSRPDALLRHVRKTSQCLFLRRTGAEVGQLIGPDDS